MTSQEKNIPLRGRRPLGAVSGREAILPVAMQYFSRYGYEGTSLRKIAAEASVDMALVARLFGSKAALWSSVLEHLHAKQSIHLKELNEIENRFASDPEQHIKSFIRYLFAVSADIPEFPSLLLNEAARGDERLDHLLKYLVTPFRESCLPIIEKAMASGIIGGKSPQITFALLIAAISLPIITPGLINTDTKLSPQLLDDMAEEVMSLIMHQN